MIERVRFTLAASARLEVDAIEDEFPSLSIEVREPARGSASWPEDAGGDVLHVDAAHWLDSAAGLRLLDEEIASAAEETAIGLEVHLPEGGDPTPRALAVLTRYQRFAPRRNATSRTRGFDGALVRHRGLHDLRKPLVRADYDHAIDTWQWLLRLEPSAGVAPQIAALFHDVERLVSESETRVEQHAPDYLAFKREHARRGAVLALEALDGCGLPERDLVRAMELVAEHEQPGESEELQLLNDADALSFFSLNSPGYLDWFGPEQTRKKVLYTLRRLSPSRRARLVAIGLRRDVARLVDEALRALAIEAQKGGAAREALLQ